MVPRIYVIHEHSATKLHWDLRLERSGALKSWAIAKEPSRTEKRLAVETTDHALAYAGFEGEIKEGYGKGSVKIWDSGTYEEQEWKPGKIVVKINGRKLNGVYVLIRPKTFEIGNWLFFRKKDD
ncbi:MAG: 3'-phosphoesterase [Candidatus Aenigmarchaeota archaeon]|nr:3'-phosphoesterase [Candidatus Aenigmarchaeota archaeon]